MGAKIKIKDDEGIEVEIDFHEDMLQNALAHSNVSLGNGIVNDIKDIIFVDPKKLDRQKSIEIANSISRINASMINENRSYLLIGPGRWGSSDHLRMSTSHETNGKAN